MSYRDLHNVWRLFRYFTKLVYGEEAYRQCNQFLFFRSGRLFTTQYASNVFRNYFATYVQKKSVSIETYRHIATGFMQKLIKGYHECMEPMDGHSDIIDVQAGHTTSAANRLYAVSTGDLTSVDKNLFHQFYMASGQWQIIIGYLKDKSSAPSATSLPPSTSTGRWRVQSVVSPRQHTYLSAKVMRQLCDFFQGDSFQFHSAEQAIGLVKVLDRQEDTLIILPTGGGKSLCFMFPAFIEATLTVAIIPLVALTDDMLQRALHHNIRAEIFRSGVNIDDRTTLLLVAVESAVSESFRTFLSRSNRLARIVVDECHLTVTWSSFRSHFWQLYQIRPQGIPFILLTATLPPSCLEALQEAFHANFRVVKAKTTRRNIAYSVNEVDGLTDMKAKMVEMVRAEIGNMAMGAGKMVLYCMLRHEVNTFHKEFTDIDVAASMYHGGMLEEDRRRNFQEWREGASKVMVATKACGVGIDVPNVRVVWHYGLSSSLLDFAQESGRGGRDGQLSRSIVLYCHQYASKHLRLIRSNGKMDSDVPDNEGDIQQLMEWCKNKQECRRMRLQGFLDGSGESCVIGRETEHCDVCKREMAISENETDTGDMIEKRVTEDTQEVTFESSPRFQQIAQNVEQAEIAQSQITRISSKLQTFFERFDNGCMLCHVNQTAYNHLMRRCPHRSSKQCLRCLGNHQVTNCEVAKLRVVLHNACAMCGMPKLLQAHHAGPYSGSCTSYAKDKLLILCWKIYRSSNGRELMAQAARQLPGTDKEFKQWLYAPNHQLIKGLNNAIVMALIYDGSLHNES